MTYCHEDRAIPLPIHIGTYHLVSKLSLSWYVSPSSTYLPLIYPPFITVFVHLLKSTEKSHKKSYCLLVVLLPLGYFVHQVASHHLHIYCVVFHLLSIPLLVKKSKKREKKEERNIQKKREVKRIEGRGCVAGCIIANFSLHIQVCGNLHSSNFISFEHMKPLGLQYRSLP